jgi:hypothetical protein
MNFPFKKMPNGSVDAEINHGRWLIRCPHCAGAEEADPKEPIFYCLSCGNADVGGHIMLAVFPLGVAAIEKTLLMRPMENRNWDPKESLQDLEAENLSHQVEV